MKRHSLRTQLVAWNVVTLALLVGALGLIIHYAAAAAILASVDHQLVGRTLPPGHGGLGGPPPQDEQLPGQVGRPPNGRFGGPPPNEGGPDNRHSGPPRGDGPQDHDDPYGPRVFNVSGSDTRAPWDARALAQAARGQQIFSIVSTAAGRLRVVSRPFPSGRPSERVLQAAYPLADADRALAGLNRVLLTLIPFALLCAAGAGTLLTGRVLGRVGTMTRAVSGMQAGDLSTRLPVVGKDEFAALAGTFNGLLVRLESAFTQQQMLLEKVQKLLERQRRFTADASHELKTPLTIIRGNTSLALSDPLSPKAMQEAMTDIDDAAQTMARLVADLLLLARTDAGQRGQTHDIISLASVLKKAVARTARPGTALVTVDISPNIPPLTGDAEELTRVFSNLLDNALRHAPSDGHVTVSSIGADQHVTITIVDTGVGIAPEHLPHLGERFYRVDEARARQDGGTGLGLSICREIVEVHRGTLIIQSTPGTGTTVTVTLPLHEKEDI